MNERPRFAPASSSEFRSDVLQEARAYLDQAGDHRYAHALTFCKALGLAVAAVSSYAIALLAASAAAFIVAYVAAVLFAMLLAMNSLHDAAHGAVFRRSWLNRAVARMASIPLGIDAQIWTMRHVHLHHAFPNIEGYDLDTEPNPFLRQTPFQRWRPWFRFQHRYWPLVAALSLPYLCWWGDWSDLFRTSKLHKLERRPIHAAAFLSAKMCHVVLMLVVPGLVMGGSVGLGVVFWTYLSALMLASCLLVGAILGTHWAEVTFYCHEPDKSIPHTWHEHQVRTSCDWEPRPVLLSALLGGLDLHLTHHLFPTYCHRHYPALSRIVERNAQRYGLPYRRIGYAQLWRAQQRFLRSMGARPPI